MTEDGKTRRGQPPGHRDEPPISVAAHEPDVEIEVGGGPNDLDLIRTGDGAPFWGTVVAIVERVSAPRHSKYYDPEGPDVRQFASLCALDPPDGQNHPRMLRAWTLTCERGRCGRGPSQICAAPRRKRGRSGFLVRDVELVLGRRPRERERVSLRALFVGRKFRVRVRPVTEDEDGRALPEASYYSVVDGPFLALMTEDDFHASTRTLTLSDSNGYDSPGQHGPPAPTTHQGEDEETRARRADSRGRLQREARLGLRRERLKKQFQQIGVASPRSEDESRLLEAERLFGGEIELHPSGRNSMSELEKVAASPRRPTR